MKSGFSPQQIEDLQQAIFYLKMSELRDLSQSLGISYEGQKRQLIFRVMQRVRGKENQETASPTRVRSGKQEYSLDSFLRPETYTNGSAARRFLKQEIGAHFRFTTYGMDWIKQQWDIGNVPTFREFIRFWEQEYLERKGGKCVASKPELARVTFFRRMAELGDYRKVELEALWQDTRLRHVQIVRSIIPDWK